MPTGPANPSPYPISQLVNMTAGFFGLQYAFGLQQSSMSTIYSYLGADPAKIPLFWLAGPVTGLLVQPLVGSLSDRSLSPRGRRTPFYFVGATICSLALIAMPFSVALWMAASLLWIMDAANNITMHPYRALVADNLHEEQQAAGFMLQSAMTGAAQTLAYLTPSLLVWLGMSQDAKTAAAIPLIIVVTFLIGAFFSQASMLWTYFRFKEPPAPPAQQGLSPGRWWHSFGDTLHAAREMPRSMKRLAPMMCLQWYAFFAYWQYIPIALASSLFQSPDPRSVGFQEAGLISGQIGAFYNAVAFVTALGMLPIVKRFGLRMTHICCLLAAGFSMLAVAQISTPALLYVPMIGIGLAWASIMGNPFAMLAKSLPPEKVGVYLGLFNVFIVAPMILEIFTLPLLYRTVLQNDPLNVIRFCGVLLLASAFATRTVDTRKE